MPAGIDPGPLALGDPVHRHRSGRAGSPSWKAALKSGRGRYWRGGIGNWVSRLVPVEILVPDSAARWRPLVQDAFRFVFERLSGAGWPPKLVEQFELSTDTAPARRLILLISKMPGLQKLGQVLARNRRLEPSLRIALIEFENGMSDVTSRTSRA